MAAVCLPVLPGCRRAEARAEKTVLVIWSSPTGPEEQGFEHLCRRFEQEHPGVIVRNTGGLQEPQFIRAIVAGVPPDLAYLYNGVSLGALAANGAVLPLDSYFARSHLREADFLPGAIAQARYKGRLYGMPTTRDSRALYWNRTCFRQAGMDPNRPPRTLEEATAFAVRLTRREPDGSLSRLGMYLPDDPPVLFAMFGGNVWDPQTGQITANRPENIAALRWLVALADAQGGYRAISAFSAGFGSDTSGQNPLATGKIAMRIDGEWSAMHLEKFAPGTDYKLGELPYPAARPGLKNVAWQDGDYMMIPNGSRHPELAWEFMRWMQEPAQQVYYAVIMNNLPTILALRNSPRLTQGPKSLQALGYVLRHIAGGSKNPCFFPSLPITELYQSALRNAFDRALYHDLTPEQALNEVQTRVKRELSRYNER
jgi:multiple sugar transport system substrate-binding protein